MNVYQRWMADVTTYIIINAKKIIINSKAYEV